MKISNIANSKADSTYELVVIGTEQEVNAFETFTKFTADFIEEELNEKFSITIMGNTGFGKKDFKAEVTRELKEFRKINKHNITD